MPAQWEDELEYDAVTETLHAKHVYVVACRPGEPDPALVTLVCSHLAGVALQTAFASPQALPTAHALWQGRSVPPHFFKLRTRDALEDDVDCFLLELLQQNWKVELDYGLGGATEAHEALLVVASVPAAHRFLEAATGCEQQQGAPLVLLETQGALVAPEEGDVAPTLSTLRGLLQPMLRTLAADVTLT